MCDFDSTHHLEEEVYVWSLVNKEPDRMPVDGDLEDEVWRRARLDGLPDHPIVEGVDQSLIQVQHQHFPLDDAQPVARQRRQAVLVITYTLVLNYLEQTCLKVSVLEDFRVDLCYTREPEVIQVIVHRRTSFSFPDKRNPLLYLA